MPDIGADMVEGASKFLIDLWSYSTYKSSG